MLSKMRKRISVNRPQLAHSLSSRAGTLSRDTPADGFALRSYEGRTAVRPRMIYANFAI